MIVYSVKDIIDGIVRSNPFWERFICIEGIVRRNRKGEFFIELDGNNMMPIANGHEGLLEDRNVKTFIANMTKLTICAVGHVNDPRSEESFHYVFDFDARTPSLAGVRLREWLLAYKTIPESLEVGERSFLKA